MNENEAIGRTSLCSIIIISIYQQESGGHNNATMGRRGANEHLGATPICGVNDDLFQS